MIAKMYSPTLTKTQKKLVYAQFMQNVEAALPEHPERAFLFSTFSKEMIFIDNPLFSQRKQVRLLFREQVSFNAELVSQIWNGIFAGENTGPAAKFTLSAAEEKTLFLQYNYARKKIVRLFRGIQHRAFHHTPRLLTPHEVETVLKWGREWKRIQDTLVVANLGLIWFMRKHFLNLEDGEYVSTGCRAIMKAADRFDIARGFRFSTYACRSIFQNSNRARWEDGYIKTHEVVLKDKNEDDMLDAFPGETENKERNDILDLRGALSRKVLSPLERAIINERFFNERSLEETADACAGIAKDRLSRERIRQLQRRALNKLREALVGEEN